MLYAEVMEVDERLRPVGQIITPLDSQSATKDLKTAYEKGLRAIAICLVHAYRFDVHEKRLAQMARDIGFTQVSISSSVSPLMKFVPRGDTTVVDAYLSPILRNYVDRLEDHPNIAIKMST